MGEEISFDLSDGEYWTAPSRTEEKLCDRLLFDGFRGTFLGAPQRVDITQRETLPVLACYVSTLKEMSSTPFGDHAVLIASDLFRNQVRADMAEMIDNPEPIEGDIDGVIPKGASAEVHVIEARERLDLPWRPAPFLLTLIVRDRVSNRVRVDLERASHEDREVDKFLYEEWHKANPSPPYPTPGAPFPSYEAHEDSPALPKKQGIALKVARVSVLRESSELILHGSFRLPALPQEVVKPEQDEAGEEAGAGPKATAIVGISLLLTGADKASATQLAMRVPSYTKIDPAAEKPEITGYFSIDLLKLRSLRELPQTYFVYAFSGEVLEGPVPTALVGEDMLPDDE